MQKLAFVIPWFGLDIPGGAESHCREMVFHLNGRGFPTEVLTTCVKEFASNWNRNYHAPGAYREGGITVRRFGVRPGNHEVFNALNRRLLRGEELTVQEELQFMREIVNSDELLRFIETHARDYFFFFMPYMFGTTFWGSQVCPDRSFLIPCLHDEPYARMTLMRLMFEKIRAILFNSPAEKALAESLFDLSQVSSIVMGEGLEVGFNISPERCPLEYPFIIYAGRKDQTKNVDLLVRSFEVYKQQCPSDLRLVLIGSGKLPLTGDCIDLGFVDTEEKNTLLSAARLLCQPSVHESFSKSIMESWLFARPVLVHGDCDVTRDHVQRSQGGLYFTDYYQFEAALDYLVQNEDEAAEMGQRGRHYVLQNYTWDKVLGRFEQWFSSLRSR
ncbi:MAG: glycosyltransferase [Acidobacteria bacterium]|nr:glycosyltransferase [Acidobacteriota bacterium]